MQIKNIILVIFCVALTFFTTSAKYYKARAEKSELAYQQLRATFEENQKMLQKYQQQMSKLTTELNSVTAQANQRKQVLQEVLANEKNQKWRNEPVPDDVIRVFKERSRGGETKINLPADNGVQKH